MQTANMELLIRKFEQKLISDGYDAKWDARTSEYPGVTLLIPLESDGTSLVFTEVHLIPLATGRHIMQFYTTVCGEIVDAGLAELEKAIAHWNIDVAVGSFGLYHEGRQLYQKYSLIFADVAEADLCVALAAETLTLIMIELEKYYDALCAIASGRSRFKPAHRPE